MHRSGDMVSLLRDALGFVGQVYSRSYLDGDEDEINLQADSEQTRAKNTRGDNEFLELLKDMHEKLYLGCKTFSKLSFILHLYHLKCLNGWIGKSFSMLPELLLDAFPEGVSLPKPYYEARKIILELGLHYERIHACKNDCMLFWGER